jgi:hypothetical protein
MGIGGEGGEDYGGGEGEGEVCGVVIIGDFGSRGWGGRHYGGGGGRRSRSFRGKKGGGGRVVEDRDDKVGLIGALGGCLVALYSVPCLQVV